MARFMEKFAVCNVAHSAARRRSPPSCTPSCRGQLHRRPRLGQAPAARHHAVRPGRRRDVPSPRLPRRHRPAADARRDARVPRRHRAGQAEQADRSPARPAGVRRLLGEQVGRPAAAQPVPRRHQGDVQPRRLAARRASARTSRTTSSSARSSPRRAARSATGRRSSSATAASRTRSPRMVSQLFLGVRLDCASCHHHPFEVWSQDDFYSFAAYFGRIGRKGVGLSPPISGGEEIVFAGRPGEVQASGHRQGDGAAAAVRHSRATIADGPRSARGAGRLDHVAGQPVFRPGDRQPRLGRPDGPRPRRAGGRPARHQPAEQRPAARRPGRDFRKNGYDLKKLIRTI